MRVGLLHIRCDLDNLSLDGLDVASHGACRVNHEAQIGLLRLLDHPHHIAHGSLALGQAELSPRGIELGLRLPCLGLPKLLVELLFALHHGLKLLAVGSRRCALFHGLHESRIAPQQLAHLRLFRDGFLGGLATLDLERAEVSLLLVGTRGRARLHLRHEGLVAPNKLVPRLEGAHRVGISLGLLNGSHGRIELGRLSARRSAGAQLAHQLGVAFHEALRVHGARLELDGGALLILCSDRGHRVVEPFGIGTRGRACLHLRHEGLVAPHELGASHRCKSRAFSVAPLDLSHRSVERAVVIACGRAVVELAHERFVALDQVRECLVHERHCSTEHEGNSRSPRETRSQGERVLELVLAKSGCQLSFWKPTMRMQQTHCTVQLLQVQYGCNCC